MPEIDQISQSIGELKSICTDTRDAVGIIRGDQVCMRREIDWLKKAVDNINPYIPVMQDVASVKKMGGMGVKAALALGAAGLLSPLVMWLKNHWHP